MNICVFCSANDLQEKYTRPAEELARLIAKHGHTLVWGGTDTGLMKTIASAAQNAGGKIIGITMETLKKDARKNADGMITTDSLDERKTAMINASDIIVVLVGGIGTLDETAEVMELKKLHIHKKPIIILNTDNFYEGLKIQLDKMKKEGFIANPNEELVFFVDTPQEAMEHLKQVALEN